jgi:tRNA-dihydrouridine synthase
MIPDLARYHAFKERAAKLPYVEVTREEFVARLIAKGETPEKAEQTAKIAEGLGSHIEINNEMVGIKK